MNYKTHLYCKWSKKEKDLMFHFPRSCDAHFLRDVLSKKVTDELELRGYDIKTLKFSIAKKP